MEQPSDETHLFNSYTVIGWQKLKTVLIHDWYDKYGGAERVITSISEVLSFDHYYTYANLMNGTSLETTFAKPGVVVVASTFVKPFRAYFRYLMPLFPLVVKLFNKQTRNNNVDLVISSSWALSKGYRVGNEIHISYFQARNFKYVWEESDLYFKGIRRLFSFVKAPLRKFDLRTAKNPDYIIANSVFVKKWIMEKYGRESKVIYPPVDLMAFEIAAQKSDYFITVGRLEPYKRFDIIVKAFNKNGLKLIVVGDGSQMPYLKSVANVNISFLGFKKKEEFGQLLNKAQAFVYAGVEDFGIAIVEALAAGTPVIAYKGGAATELIDSQKNNGVLYEKQTVEALTEAINNFQNCAKSFTPESIRNTSLHFSKQRFQQEFLEYVNTVIEQNSKIIVGTQ